VQLLGAVIGAWLIQLCTPEYLQRGLGSHDLGRSIFDSQGCLMEIMLTFMLIFVIFGVAVDRRGPGKFSTSSQKKRNLLLLEEKSME
jgi:glycerol uptake facilitator-like aquaporin